MNYYSDDYPDVTLEEFLDVYQRLTKYAQREVQDLAISLANTVTAGQGPNESD